MPGFRERTSGSGGTTIIRFLESLDSEVHATVGTRYCERRNWDTSSARHVGMALDEAQVQQGFRIDRGVHHALALIPGDLVVDVAHVQARLGVDVEGRGLDQADGPVRRLP